MAPEIQKGESYGDKADLWSIGIILFELMSGIPPFVGATRAQLYANIEKGAYSFPPNVFPSSLCVDLLNKLLISNAQNRLSWKDFFEHPFIKCDAKTYPLIYEEMMSGVIIK